MSEVEVDPYELLQLTAEASDADIRKAYRQRSLKVHPDRNPNNPDAARKFHELNQAYELLLDPLRRMALDATLRLKRARAERFQNYDNKRKNLVEELEQREQAFKKARMDKQKDEVAKWQETEEIKDEGRRMREERAQKLAEREKAQQASEAVDDVPILVRVKYTLAEHPELTTSEALASLFAAFGEADNIVVLLKPPKKAPTKPPKYGTALIPFKKIGDAFAAVCASARTEQNLGGIEVSWVGSSEPPILGWLRKMGQLGTPAAPSSSSTIPTNSKSTGTAFSSFPETLPTLPKEPTEAQTTQAGIDYESLTLMRLRQAERERLEREIREQEENE
ncbi:DnaJ domain-containing protein [Mycena floridula]|nr:DnaJ domain-containing protein [Mycena floridula]